MALLREFRLSPQGVSCDENGAFLASIPLLKRSHANNKDCWQPIDTEQLSEQLSSQFGLPIDMSRKMGGLKTIADALNAGDVARAQIGAVLLGIPDPPALLKGPQSLGTMIKFVRDLDWSGMIKADTNGNPANSSDPTVGPKSQGYIARALTKAGFNPDEPRDEHGRWTNQTSGSAESDANTAGARLANAGMSDASDGPVAEAAARAAAAAARRNSRAAPVKPVDRKHDDFWQTVGSRISNEVQSALSEVARAQINETNANIAGASAATNAIADELGAYANYRAKPWIGRDGVPIQVPVINSGDPYSGLSTLLAYERAEPNAPLTRPATNADWIDPLVDLASAGAVVAGPILGAVGEASTVAADSSALAADSPFIILPAELRADFDITWPIGKYQIPKNLVPGTKAFGDHVHEQISTLLQDAVGPNVNLKLNTAPSAFGVDVKVPLNNIDTIGFEFAEIKPLSRSGYNRFNDQVMNIWDLEGRVQAITYDQNGNIYYGFPGPW